MSIDIRVGQIWKNRKRLPDSLFVVIDVWTKVYANNSAERVYGLQVHDGMFHYRDLDMRSCQKMYPHLMIDTTPNEKEENK